MNLSATTVRRGLYGVLAGGLLGGVASAAMIMPTANAEPVTPMTPDNCTFSGAANTSSTVSAEMSTYLAAHPETNEDLTEIAKQPMTEAQVQYRAYFAKNPQVESELKAINQPAVDLVSQCGIVVRPTPISEALQGV
ncbi:heme-binding protein [Mycolicibacterium stellerae]|uniref:heme-binding protein n=1 Tax=Mycolicibacterium stellerae TaxID=2358193 RepID=UPI000F0B35FD|nr:heme-binding protein [Mycolicibacterium stellerae]